MEGWLGGVEGEGGGARDEGIWRQKGRNNSKMCSFMNASVSISVKINRAHFVFASNTRMVARSLMKESCLTCLNTGFS